jgi:hypothetical protein
MVQAKYKSNSCCRVSRRWRNDNNDDDEDDISSVGGVELHCAHPKMIIDLIHFVSLCVFFS